ncbi:retrovirus-related pol polyprotein from transposon TNT 1-94 [Tanacetum coccineum]
MLCYLAGMEPYYLKCIKDGLFQPKTVEGDAKLESQWTLDERRVVVQDQRLKSIIMSCLPDDIMESVADFQENSDDEVDERTSEEYLRDLDIEYHERALLANSKRFIKRRNNFSGQKANENIECYKCGNKGHFARDYFSNNVETFYKSPVNNYSSVSKGFQPRFTLKLIQSSSNSNNQADQKFQKDYKAEYKKMKAKLALLETKVSDEEEVTQVKVLMALADDELTVGKSHARNGEWVDITMRKVNTLLSMDEDADWQNYLKYINIDLNQSFDAVTFQIQNTELIKSENHALQEQLKVEKKINWKMANLLKKASPSSEVLPLTFQPHSPKERPGLGIMKHTKPETQDSSNESVLGIVTVNESKQTTPSVPTEVKDTEQKSKLNELTKLIQMLIDEKVNFDQKTQESNSKIQKAESSKSVDSSKISQDSKPKVQSTGSSKSLRPKPIQKPQLKCELCHYTNHSTDDCYRILYCMICKREDHRTSDHEMYIALLKRSENYKAQPYQYASSSKQILRAKAKPFPP